MSKKNVKTKNNHEDYTDTDSQSDEIIAEDEDADGYEDSDIREYDDEDDFSIYLKKYPSSADEEEYPDDEYYYDDEYYDDEEEYRERSPLKIFTVIAVSFVVACFIAFGAYAYYLPQDKVNKNVTVNGVEIGGMTRIQAQYKLENTDISQSINIAAGEKQYTVKPTDISAKFDVEKTVDRVFEYAKTNNRIADAVTSLKTMIFGKDIAPVITYDKEKLTEILDEIGKEAIGDEMVNHHLRLADDGTAYIVPGIPGYDSDPSDLLEQVEKALNNDFSTDISLKLEKTTPLNLTIKALDEIMYKNAVDASYAIEDGKVVVKPEEYGRYIDKDYCKSLLSKIYVGGPEVEIPYKKIPAEVTADVLREKMFNGELYSYSTRFNAGDYNRTINVKNAASKIDGTYVLPGETFSFNKTVGKRTTSNGFKPAPEYLQGKSVMGIGGGTCQVSSTLYNAVLYSGLKIVRRQNHSMPVSYVPLGQDATVTDGGLDFQFMNNTKYPVKIEAYVEGGTVTVEVVGTSPEPARTYKIQNSTTGLKVKTSRIAYDENGDEVNREYISTSVYKPHS